MKFQIFKNAFLLSLFFIGLSLEAQNVSGTISDSSGPLPGASILVKGTTSGTNSDFEGNYTLTNVAPDAVLVVSYVGYVTQEIPVNGRSVIDVLLVEDANALEEVVVVGYGTQKKALTTGAGVNVKGEDIAALNTQNAMQALQGTTAGVSITRNDGQPGSGTRVTIRGIGTIGNANPLYIVDGVPVGDIDYLNPSDIANIDVLKDAASAAIYGSRAANGVVLVTTVKGRKGSPAKISFDSFYGVQNIYKNLDPLNAQEYMYIMDEGRVNDGLAPNDWQAILSNNNWLRNNYPGLDTQLGDDIWGMLQNGWEGTNWIDEISSPDAPMQSYALNITGGSEDVTYSLGASYLDQESMLGADIVDAGFKRLTARLNTEMVLKKNSVHNIITVGQNLTYTNTENRAIAAGNIYWNDLHDALVQNPLMPAYWQPAIDNNVSPFGFTPTLDGLANDQHNPIATMFYRHNYNYGKGNKVIGNVYLEVEPIEDLKIRTSYGIDSWFGWGRSMRAKYALGDLFTNPNDGASQNQYFGNNWTWTTTASYKWDLNDKHHFSALIGNEILQNQINNEVGGSRNNLLFPGLPQYAYLNNTQAPESVNDINIYGADWAAGGGGLVSYMGRLSYDYDEKYLFTAIVRADGSSNFAEENRWGTFPSFSGGWILSKEDFMESVSDVIDFAKVRGSWGQNGNQSIPNFIYSSNITYAFPGYFFGDTKPISGTTAYPERVTNPDVTWETSEQLNFGFDVNMFDSRLGLTFDWYKKSTIDWLLEAPILGTSGAAAPFINGGDVENTGIEFVINWKENLGDWDYGITLTGTQNKNEVVRIANTDGIIQGPGSVISQGTAPVSRVQEGYPIGYFYGYQTDGLLQNQDDVDAYVGPDGTPYFSDQRPGDVKFVDRNNDGVINEDDKTMIGNPNPDFELGLQLNVAWKGFYANATLAGKYGMQVMQSYRSFADRFDQNYTSQIFGRWHGEGTSNRIPRLTAGSNRNTNFVSDIYVYDADYLRINNVTFGYDFKTLLRDVKAVSGGKIYVSVNNLHTFTDYDGMDPEVRYGGTSWASGVDLGLFPQARTVMFGLNVDF